MTNIEDFLIFQIFYNNEIKNRRRRAESTCAQQSARLKFFSEVSTERSADGCRAVAMANIEEFLIFQNFL